MIENFIDSIWILEIESGIVIYEEIYKDITKYGISTDLILNFLSALVNFAGEVFVDELKHIKLSNHKIFFNFLKHIIVVISITDKISIEETKLSVLIDRIGKKFESKYEHLYNNEFWYVNIEVFNSFSKDLREFIKREPEPIKIVHSINFAEKIKKLNELIDNETNKFLNRKLKLEKVYEQRVERLESKKKNTI